MAAFRRLVLALAVLGLFAGLASAQTVTPMQCTLTSYPDTVRVESLSDQVGDLVVTCLQGTALPGINTANGTAIPRINFTVQLGGANAITSRMTNTAGAGGVSDSLLMIDQPGTTSGAFQTYGSDQAATVCNSPTDGNCGTPYGYVLGNGQIVMSDNQTGPPTNNAPNVYQGIVSGNAVTFFGIPILAPVSAGQARIFRITNIRVNSTTLSAGSPVSASITFTGNNVQQLISLPNNSAQVAVVQTGLNGTNTKATAGSYPVCNNAGSTTPVTPYAISSIVFAENFGNAFKSRLIGNVNAGSSYSKDLTEQQLPGTYPSESGVTISLPTSGTLNTAYTSSGLADFGTRLKATFNNIPAGVRLFVSASNVTTALVSTSTLTQGAGNVIASNTSTSYAAAITGSESAVDGTSGPSAATATGSSGTFAGWVEITPTSGSTATAVWEVENQNPTAIESFIFNVGVIYTANVPPVTGTTANPSPTVLMSYAPTTETTTIPAFVIANTNPQTAFNLTNCRTILLFPYVTSNGGFDTGIAISNTTADPLGTSAQAGTCSLNWYPSGTATATSTVAGAAITPTTTPTVIGGTTYLNTASSLAPGFTGYMIAVCNFQYAHGFAFVADWGSSTTSSAMGYLALIIPDPGVGTTNHRAVGPFTGTNETLGE